MQTKMIDRDKICLGLLAQGTRVYRFNSNVELFGIKPGELAISTKHILRNTLFVIDENKMADDLLYPGKRYPILNLTDDNACILAGDKPIVDDYTNLGTLLKCFNYKEQLTEEELLILAKKIFTLCFFARVKGCSKEYLAEIKAEINYQFRDLFFYDDVFEIAKSKTLNKKHV